MIKRLIFLLLEFIAGLTGNLIAGWIQQDRWSNLFTTERLLATIVSAILVMFLLGWLESNQSSTVIVHWYKFWYLVDLRRNFKYWAIKYAPLPYKYILNSKEVLGNQIQRRQENDIVIMLRNLLIESNLTTTRALLFGEAGVGKTTVFKKLTIEMANYAINSGGINRPIPIFVELGNYSGEKLLDFISEQLIARSKQGSALAKMLPYLLEHGHILLLMDALDEAMGEQSKKITQELAELLQNPNFQHSPILISSRIQDGRNYLFTELTTYEIQELGDNELISYIEVYNQSDTNTENIKNWLSSHNMLRENGLGRNPFWLKLILNGWVTQRDAQFNNYVGDSGQFLNRSIDNLLAREWDAKLKAERSWRRVIPRIEQLEQTKNGLAHLAFWMMCSNHTASISKEIALIELSHWINSHVGIEALRPQDILGLGHDAQLLMFESNAVQFSHRLIQESLIAWELKARDLSLFQNNQLLQYIENVTWWESLILLGEILYEENRKNYDQFVKLILDCGAKERSLILAMGIVMSSRDIDDNAQSEILTALNRQLLQNSTLLFKQAVIDLATVLNGKKLIFLESLLIHSPEEIQIIVIDILSAIKSDYAINLLISSLRSPSLSSYAILALGTIGSTAAVSLVEVLQDENTDFRISVIKCLGVIGDNRAIQPLIHLFQDNNIKIRAVASASLQKIGDSAIEPLCKVLLQSELNICAIAAETLTGMGENAAVQVTQILTSSRKIYIQVACAWILWNLGAPCVKTLSNILEIIDINSWARDNKENLSMRALGAMIPVYRRSPDLFHRVVWRELSPKASDIVGRVLLKRNWAEINARLFAEYVVHHPKDETIETAATLRAYLMEKEKDEKTYVDEAIYEYVSHPALRVAYEITDISNQLKTARTDLTH